MSDPDESEPKEQEQNPQEQSPHEQSPGIEQFQKAALEALRAARAMIDAAESIVTDPKAVESVISSVAGVARDATAAVAGFAAGASRSDSGPDCDAESDDPDDGFKSIHVD